MNGKEESKKEKVSLVEFKEALKIFKSMLRDGDIKLDFFPSYFVFGAEDDRLDDELTSSKIGKETFGTWVTEAINLLRRLLSDKEKSFLKRYPEDEREEIEKKCELIEKEILTKELVEKYLFQTTCKNYLFDEFDWEIMEHRGKEEDESFSTVVMQFKLRDPSKAERVPSEREYISFECRKGNIEELIEELEKIKKRFEKR